MKGPQFNIWTSKQISELVFSCSVAICVTFVNIKKHFDFDVSFLGKAGVKMVWKLRRALCFAKFRNFDHICYKNGFMLHC